MYRECTVSVLGSVWVNRKSVWPVFGQTDFCFRCKNLFWRDVLGFLENVEKQKICLSPPAGPKICFINLFSVHKSER